MKTRNAARVESRSSFMEVIKKKQKQQQQKKKKKKRGVCSTTQQPVQSTKKRLTYSAHFLGPPFPTALAQKRWPHRYSTHKQGAEKERPDTTIEEGILLTTKCRAHYSKAEVDGHTYELNDHVTVNADGAQDYTGRILEFFETIDEASWLEIQWMFRPEDTVLGQEEAKNQDKKRLFYSDETDVIPLECITSKIKVLQTQPQLHLASKGKRVVRADFYYDMGYAYDYSTFYTINSAIKTGAADASHSSSTVSNPTSTQRVKRSQRHASPVDLASEVHKEEVVNRRITRAFKFEPSKVANMAPQNASSNSDSCIDRASESKQNKKADSVLDGASRKELSLLDMYSGCGGMSTGLCMGASLSNVKLETRWAVDINEFACESFKLNHPNAEVRNEAAEDFFSLIKEWQQLCQKYTSDQIPTSSAKSEIECSDERIGKNHIYLAKRKRGTCDRDSDNDSRNLEDGEYEVEKIIGVRWLDPTKHRKSGLEFKVHWRGYPDDEDSWEPLDSLMKCEERLRDFIAAGKTKKILPLPGEVDIVCGGPPCQGISGLNRFRNMEAPLEDPKNQQIVVFMDIVEFLKPRFVFLENVVDILHFSGGLLSRYALSRLVQMHYQAKIGLLVAGCYGLPQFRMRFFLLGASPFEDLPAFPLPTHDVLLKGSKPSEWERNIVAYTENCLPQLNEAILLKDAISDLPPVTNAEKREQLHYIKPPSTDFQKFMRSPKENNDLPKAEAFVEDHRPLLLNRDNFERICRIPKKKGANFRDLPGIQRLSNGTVQVDVKKVIRLSSGKKLVPNYALNYMQGKSARPFGRIWWDEILSTLHTRPAPHAQKCIHPTQDRVLTIRECARLQGFPDYYKFRGPIKER